MSYNEMASNEITVITELLNSQVKLFIVLQVSCYFT